MNERVLRALNKIAADKVYPPMEPEVTPPNKTTTVRPLEPVVQPSPKTNTTRSPQQTVPTGWWSKDPALSYATKLITDFEGFREKPYKCSAGVCTIGFGTTNPDIIAKYPNGISRDAAYELAARDTKAGLDRMNMDPDFNKLNAAQKAAFASLAYNIGVGRAMTSTAWKHMKAGRHADVPAAMAMWNKANGEVLPGLERRRRVEGNMYMKSPPTSTVAMQK